MTDPGRIVILNGAPRSGKSSIAAQIQETFEGIWVNLGVDAARRTTPQRCQPGIGLRPGEEAHPVAPFVPVLYAALYESIAAHSRAGLNVVVDVGHHDPRGLHATPGRTACHDRRSRCPIEVIVERRNAAPSGYVTGSTEVSIPEPVVRWQEAVHVPGVYDLEVDTSLSAPLECADAIRRYLDEGGATDAAETLATMPTRPGSATMNSDCYSA